MMLFQRHATSSGKQLKRSRSFSFFVVVLLTIHSVMLGWIAWNSSPNIDEVGHLAAGVSHWHFGSFQLYSVNPPLVRTVATIPVVLSRPETNWEHVSDAVGARPEWVVGHDFIAANGDQSLFFFRVARFMCIPFSLLGAIVCIFWGRELCGNSGGMIAGILWCFSPNVLTWGATINPDIGAASLSVVATYSVWKGVAAGTPRPWMSGVLAGLACLTKFTCLVFLPVWVAYILSDHRHSIKQRVKHSITMLCVALYIINLGYGFEGSLRSLGSYTFVSHSLAGECSFADGGDGGNRFSETVLSAIPVPLPENFVKGIDLQKFDFERGVNCFLLGEWKHTGWWYYYLIAFFVKEPIGTVALASATVLCLCTRRVRFDASLVLLTTSVLVVAVLVSSQTGICRYLRYMLPAFPFLFLLLACVVSGRGQVQKWCVGACLMWTVMSCVSAFPHTLPYFNEFAGGSRWGHYVLVDANIDWGHGTLYLRKWIDRHPENSPLYLDLYPSSDLRYFELGEFTSMSELSVNLDHEEMPIEDMLPNGWYAVSAHRLHLPGPLYYKFRQRSPDAIVADCIYIFHIESPSHNLKENVMFKDPRQ